MFWGPFHVFDWDDVRVFVAVAAEGSTLAASRKLGMNQTTVSRRVQALEHALKLTLFERDTRGYALTPQGSALLDVAGQMAASAKNVELRAEHLARDMAGTIRISSPSMAMEHWGFPVLAKFRQHHPEIEFDIDTSESQVSLEHGEADIALRAADKVIGDTLVARKLCTIPWGVYGSRGYLLKSGTPRGIEECEGHDFLNYVDDIVSKIRCVDWFTSQINTSRIVQRVNTVLAMAGSLKTGFGLGVLPCVVGGNAEDLVCCFRHDALSHPLWIVASHEGYMQPRVRAFMSFTAENFPHDSFWERA